MLNYYLPDDFVADSPLEVAVGIDVGNHVNLDISYTGTEKETRMFNTNGGTLTINNANADVNHYGSAKVVAIEAVAQSSYHCYAEVVGSINVAQGHVVVEAGAEVPLINVVAPKEEVADAKVKIEYQPAAKQDIPVIVESGVAEGTLADDAIPTSAPTVDLSDTETYGEDVVAISTYKANGGQKSVYAYTKEEFLNPETNPLNTKNCLPNGTTEITLLQDITMKDVVAESIDQGGGSFSQKGRVFILSDNASFNIVFNLNGYSITYDLQYKALKDTYSQAVNYNYLRAGAVEIGAGTGSAPIDVTFKNGSIKNVSTTDNAHKTFMVNDGCSLTLEDVACEWKYEIMGNWIFVAGRAKVAIKNSTIDNIYSSAVTTNASRESNWEVQIDIENTTVTSLGTALTLNVPGTLTVKNSKLSGGLNAALIRGGTATFIDTELSIIETHLGEKTTFPYDAPWDPYAEKTWGQGNAVAYAALTIGNKTKETYQYKSTVSLTRCTFNVVDDPTKQHEKNPAIYIWANNAPNAGVELTYTDCNFNGNQVLAGGQAIEGLGNGLDHLTVIADGVTTDYHDSESITGPVDLLK